MFKLGVTARDVHFDIRKISIKDLPEDDEELGNWLKEHWARKEEKLRRFYAQPKDTRRLETAPESKTFEVRYLSGSYAYLHLSADS